MKWVHFIEPHQSSNPIQIGNQNKPPHFISPTHKAEKLPPCIQKGFMTTIMASRIAVRNFSRRFSSSGKVLSEEEKAAENVYIKKVEQEKLEKMARKGPKPEETPAASSGSGAEAKPTSAAGASTEKVSTDQYRNYAVIAGIITGVSALGWYLKSSRKKEQVQD